MHFGIMFQRKYYLAGKMFRYRKDQGNWRCEIAGDQLVFVPHGVIQLVFIYFCGAMIEELAYTVSKRTPQP
jgi:hypothetical protein